MSLLNAQVTKSAFFWTRLLSVPFWVLLNLLPIILYKDLSISPWLVTAMVMLKPASALFASYWGMLVQEREDRLVSNVVIANVLRYLPFVFLPWIDSPWLMALAFGNYMVFSRGVIPAWMEIFKKNLEADSRSRVFTYGSMVDYVGSALLPLGFGFILDDYALSWRFLFPITALLGLTATLFILKLPKTALKEEVKEIIPLKSHLLKPWKEAFNLLKTRKDFAKFQMGFMLGAAALMIMQPIIPIFFVDTLQLSYTEMLMALSVCKAMGYAIGSPFSIKLFERFNIFQFCSMVCVLIALFPFLLMSASLYPWMIYVAYIIYGIMQSGSELSWHMSGPIFSMEKESSPFSTTNVLLVGIRGCIAPPLGALIFVVAGATNALIVGSLFALVAVGEFLKNFNSVKSRTSS